LGAAPQRQRAPDGNRNGFPMKKLIAFVLCLAASVAFAGVMSEEEFTAAFVKQAAAEIKDADFKSVEPLRFNVKYKSGAVATAFLGNAYAQYKSAPEKLPDIFGSQIASLKAQAQTLGPQPNSAIFAVIKPADYIDTMNQQLAQANAGDGHPIVTERLNDDLFVVYVFDTEESMRLVMKSDLAEKHLEEKALRSIAVKNLSGYFDAKKVSIVRVEDVGDAKIFIVALDENYEASILLLDQYWNRKNFDVKGELIVFVPARNIVIVTGSEDQDGLRIAGYLADKGFRELGYSVSPHGYKYDAGNWKRFEP
jgi:uncharacterized protein YtpQ (UPF0354 family)